MHSSSLIWQLVLLREGWVLGGSLSHLPDLPFLWPGTSSSGKCSVNLLGVGKSSRASQGILSFFLLEVNNLVWVAGALTPTYIQMFPPGAHPKPGHLVKLHPCAAHGAGDSCAPNLSHPSLAWLKIKQSEEKLSSRGHLYVRVNSGCACTRYTYICIYGS